MDALSLSSTGILDASLCLKRYQYHFVERLVPKPALVRHPLRRGIWIHACLEAYHLGRPWLDVLGALHRWADSQGVPLEECDTLRAEVHTIMDGYTEYWAAERQGLTPVLTEQELTVTFGTRTIRATLDLVALAPDRNRYIVEHKSTSRIPSAQWQGIDVQTVLQYVVAAANGIAVDGILFNYLNTKTPPQLRFKKDGDLYANVGVTTTATFNRSLREHLEELRAGGAGPDTLSRTVERVEARRAELVNDSLYYQRWPVLRPKALVVETMRDVAAIFEAVERATDGGRFPRSVHTLNCEFCPYSELCATEYRLGKEAPILRRDSFDRDTGFREGRIVIPQPSGDIELFSAENGEEY